MRLGGALAALLLLLLAAGTGHGESRHNPPEPPAQATADPNLSPLELLELGAPAVRYLRAFTTQCWQPDQSAPIAMFDNSWAVALVTIWNDLTVPSNGLGRLVTAMQLQQEGAIMIQNKRPTDALSVLELSVLFTLYPVHHELRALAAWHQSLASNDTAFVTRRASLARSLMLMSQAQAALGAASSSVDAYEAAMISGRAAGELFALGDPSADGALASTPHSAAGSDAGDCAFQAAACGGCSACGGGCAPQGGACGAPAGQRLNADSEPAAAARDLQKLLAEVARSTAELLQRVEVPALEQLLDRRGLKCRWNCGRRSSLLKMLVPALRVPLRLVPGADGEEAAGVEAPPGLEGKLAKQMALRRGNGSGDLARLGNLFAGVVATLQQPLLNDVNIKCSSSGGQPQLHRCREQAEQQFAMMAGAPVTPAPDMHALLAHVNQVEEALWRLDEVLEAAMAGVRLGDGTTWVKSRGYTWVLGSYMAAKLYPQGQGSPVYYQTRRPTEPHAGSTICLDKTYLLDTVLRLDPDGLRGLQYALDNLHYAQFAAGGADAFWRLLAKDNPLCSGSGCQTGQDPMSLLVAAEGGGSGQAAAAPRTPRPMPLPDFRFLGEQQLQANLAAATDPSYRGRDPFVAAFVSLCVVSCASLYLYSHRGRLVRALTPTRGRAPAAPAASSAVLQRNAATAALREALSGDSAQKLLSTIEAAEAAGVEKPLVKKARAALQALKRRRVQQGGGGTAPPAHRQQASSRGGSGVAAAASGAGAALLPAGSGLSSSSSMGSGSLPRSLSERTAALYAAAAEGWLDNASEAGSAAATSTDPGAQAQGAQPGGAGGSPGSSRAMSPIRTRSGKLSSQAEGSDQLDHSTPTPPKTSHLAPHSSSEPEPPNSPGTPVDVQPRGSPTEGPGRLLSSDNCTPLASPGLAPAAAAAAAAAGASAAVEGSASPPSPVALPPSDERQRSEEGSSAAEPAGTPSRSPSAASSSRSGAAALASPPAVSGLTAEALSADAIPAEELAAAAALRQMTPRQLKKLLRLQQKRASGGPGSVAASEEADAASAPSPARQGSAAGGSVASDDADAAAPLLTARELAALAAREESAPSKVPRSAKKKAKREAERAAAAQAAPQSGSEAGNERAERGGERVWRDGRHGSGRHEYGQGGSREVRRTLSDPQQAFGLPGGALSPLRHAGYGQHEEGGMLDPRLRGMAEYPAPAYWQVAGGAASLNAHAPEFSPQPSPNRPSGPSSRLTSPGGHPGMAFGDGTSVRGSPFVGADLRAQLGAGAYAVGSQSSLGLPYSPDGSLGYSLGGSGPASLEPSAAAAAAAAQLAGASGQPQQASLLAQLQQIWGEGSGGGGAAASAAAFGASLGASPAATLLASEAAAAVQHQQQQQQQLAALLFMQQLEMQQAALAARSLTPGRGGMPDSPPLSPQQLPAASADMLRDVLGSPLSPLRWPSGRSGGGGGTGDFITDPSLSLGAEMAAAAASALREIGEAGDEPAGSVRGRPAAARSLADGGSQAQRQLASPERPSFESMDLGALGFTELLD